MARPEHNIDLHGNAPDSSGVALLLVDLLNDFRFEGGAKLERETSLVLENLVALKAAARAHDVPVIYVNDNSGLWRSDHNVVLKKAMAPKSRGKTIAAKLRPHKTDYIILKPKQSAFYGTPLEILLDYLRVKRLVLAGISADICVFFTAQDAFIRDYDLWVPRDAVASETRELTDSALEEMERLYKARVTPVLEVQWRVKQSRTA
jgi:nicotinamidase-related amidase